MNRPMVEIFGLKDILKDAESFIKYVAKFNSIYEPDYYLLRQNQLIYLKKT